MKLWATNDNQIGNSTPCSNRAFLVLVYGTYNTGAQGCVNGVNSACLIDALFNKDEAVMWTKKKSSRLWTDVGKKKKKLVLGILLSLHSLPFLFGSIHRHGGQATDNPLHLFLSMHSSIGRRRGGGKMGTPEG